MTMILEKLEIELHSWGDFVGQYTGKIKYRDVTGCVEMTLDPEMSNLLLAACGENIAAMTKKIHQDFREAILESVAKARGVKAIAAPTEPVEV
jgi:hypothetical protein